MQRQPQIPFRCRRSARAQRPARERAAIHPADGTGTLDAALACKPYVEISAKTGLKGQMGYFAVPGASGPVYGIQLVVSGSATAGSSQASGGTTVFIDANKKITIGVNYTRIAAQPDVDAALAQTEPPVLTAVIGRGSDAAESHSGSLATIGGAGEATVAVADTVLAPPRVRGLSSSGCDYAVAPPPAEAQSQVATGRTRRPSPTPPRV